MAPTTDDLLPPCPACGSALTYPDGATLVCPECGHEWPMGNGNAGGGTGADAPADTATVHRDALGNVLADGDTVTIVKDLKVKGASSALKVGTKVRGIRLVDGDHNIDCRIDGFGAMKLKSEFVKKTT